MTIDELARAAGLVASTVRLYQNKGVLPPPTRRGRVGYYGPAHLGRLRLVGQLQERGFSLAAIKQLLDGMDRGESLAAVLGLGDGSSTWTAEKSEQMSLAELASHLPKVELDAELLRRAVGLGLVELSESGTDVVVRSPSSIRVGRDLAALGVPPDTILDEYEALRTETARIATRFTKVFRTYLWDPFVESGMPADQVTPLIGALEQLGPLAEAVVISALRQSLQQVAERFVAAEAERLDVDIPRPGQNNEMPGPPATVTPLRPTATDG